MADDKQTGDDLFEDLDKFFAPIRDVDWDADEPAVGATQRLFSQLWPAGHGCSASQ